MITRAQAEALLSLAESLEACERVGVGLRADLDGENMLDISDNYRDSIDLDSFQGASIRKAVQALIPKQEI